MLDFFSVKLIVHPRTVFVDFSNVFKFLPDPIYSFRDIAISICWRFGLKFPIHAYFRGRRLRPYSPNDGTRCSNTQINPHRAKTRLFGHEV